MASGNDVLHDMIHHLIFAEGNLRDRVASACSRLDRDALDNPSTSLPDEAVAFLVELEVTVMGPPRTSGPGSGRIERNVLAMSDGEIEELASAIHLYYTGMLCRPR